MRVVAEARKRSLEHFAATEDFRGCYVLLDRGIAFYIGISRKVIARLTQHIKGRTHFDASLAYGMACRERQHKLTRSEAMKNSQFLECFRRAKKRLLAMDAAAVDIDNDLELYLFEAYACMKLGTKDYNSFRTH
jgi:predicted GIY-YIG superfamily endonuclease